MNVTINPSVIVAINSKGLLEDGYNRCEVKTNGLHFYNQNNECTVVDYLTLASF